MKRCIVPFLVALAAFPGTALADVPSDLRAPDQQTQSEPAPRLEAKGTDVAAPDQQASLRSPAPVTVPAAAADGFDWSDAGIGGGVAAALLALSLAGGLALRRGDAARPA